MLRQENYDTIQIERLDSGVVVATLNRPERLNAVGGPMHFELAQLSRDFDADPAGRVLVITGAGRAFSSGGDFSGKDAGASKSPKYVNRLQEARQIIDNLIECSKPVIAAVNGYAMGLGASVALACDVVVAGKSAVFADTHVKVGLSAGDGGAVVWTARIGPRAKWYLMTGARVNGEDAERIGLVDRCVEDKDLMPTAMAMAEELAAGPLYAIMASKVPANQYYRFVSGMVFPLSLALEELSMTQPDHAEAVQAFQEKRAPDFRKSGA